MTDYQKRMLLLDECRKMEAAYLARLDYLGNDETLSDEEYDRLSSEAYNEHRAAYDQKWMEAFFLQFPRRKGWFADTFIASFGECDQKQLSLKQTQVVAKYCLATDATRRTGETYCRAGDKMVTLLIPKYSRGIGYLTVRTI